MANIEVDPTTINAVYKQKVAQLTDDNIMLSAAVTQLQNNLDQAQRTILALQSASGGSTKDEDEDADSDTAG